MIAILLLILLFIWVINRLPNARIRYKPRNNFTDSEPMYYQPVDTTTNEVFRAGKRFIIRTYNDGRKEIKWL